MRLFGFAGVLVGLLAASGAAQDAIEIKLARPKVGERVKVTIEEQTESKMAVNAKGMEQAKNEVKTKSLVFVDEIIEDAGGRRPTKLNRTYEKAVTGTDGNKTTLPVEGKTVLIEKKGDKYSFTVDGKSVEGEALKLLESEFQSSKGDPRDVMLPNKAVKPGDSWKIDGEKLAKMFDKDAQLDKTKLAGTGKLVKAYKEDGKQFGVIEVTITAPITDLGAKVPVKLKEGSLSLTFTGDGVIDGSSSQVKSSAAMKLKVAGGGEGFELSLDLTMNEKRTTEPLPKK